MKNIDSPYSKQFLTSNRKKNKRKLESFITTHQYIKFIIQLSFEDIYLDVFLDNLIELYLEKNPNLMKCVEEIKKRIGIKDPQKLNYYKKLKYYLDKEQKIKLRIGLNKKEIKLFKNEIEKFLPEELT